ncbi:MAG: D-alanyl-D-alanine carboxypeptidase/D-alanyl-D-alanine-endopeptidase [Bacteroidaceae bacterium]
MKQKKYTYLLLLLLSLFSIPLYAQEDVEENANEDQESFADSLRQLKDSTLLWPKSMQQGLNELLKNPIFQRTQLGLLVYDLTADSVIYAHGERQQLRPASCEKLLTAITALWQLGGSFRFETKLCYTGTLLEDSVLQGDLYLVGGFDPRFGSDDMKAFSESLVRMGITRIDGHIYADLSMKDTLRLGKGWCWDDKSTRLTPLLYNGKDIFMETLFRSLRENGITTTETFSIARTPRDAKLIASRFHSLDQILMRMMKESDNLYAEAMFYQLGAKRSGAYPSSKVSAQAVKDFIRAIGLNPSDYYIADGSGLSLYNYVTPELLVTALRYAYERNNIYLHLYPSLPIAGYDGTLEKRMRNGCAYENIYAKTGTVEGVSSLSGYATAANGHKLAFSIINQGIRHTNTGRRFQDRVCQMLTCP